MSLLDDLVIAEGYHQKMATAEGPATDKWYHADLAARLRSHISDIRHSSPTQSAMTRRGTPCGRAASPGNWLVGACIDAAPGTKTP